jgi:hypothetical protein
VNCDGEDVRELACVLCSGPAVQWERLCRACLQASQEDRGDEQAEDGPKGAEETISSLDAS